MITLREVLKLNETVTMLDLDVRQPNGRLIEQKEIEGFNTHGRPDKRGFSQAGYAIAWKEIPDKYLDSEVTTLMWIRERYGHKPGSVLKASIVPIQMEIDITDCAWK